MVDICLSDVNGADSNSFVNISVFEPSYLNSSASVAFQRSSLNTPNPISIDVHFDLQVNNAQTNNPLLSSAGLQRGAPWPMARRNSV
jgi:hypothetical protein